MLYLGSNSVLAINGVNPLDSSGKRIELTLVNAHSEKEITFVFRSQERDLFRDIIDREKPFPVLFRKGLKAKLKHGKYNFKKFTICHSGETRDGTRTK